METSPGFLRDPGSELDAGAAGVTPVVPLCKSADAAVEGAVLPLEAI
jgi:hypothetical protein